MNASIQKANGISGRSYQIAWSKLFLIVLTILSVSGLAIFAAADYAPDKDLPPEIAKLEETGNAFAAVTKAVSPAVVFIKVEVKRPAEQIPMNFPGSAMIRLASCWNALITIPGSRTV